MSLPLRAEAFIADNPGIPFKYIIGVYEDAMRNVPSPEYAEQYWKNLGSPEGLAVFSDVNEQLLPSTPFTGTQASGKCLLSPQMEILVCVNGHTSTDDWAFSVIVEREGR